MADSPDGIIDTVITAYGLATLGSKALTASPPILDEPKLNNSQ